jgi:membrane fusion protein (multidrug efflux system)
MSTEPAPSPTAPAEEPDPLHSKAFTILKFAVPLALLLCLGFWLYYRNRVSTDDAQVDGHLVPVSCKVYGSVEKVLVDDNQAVKAGDVMVELDARDLQVRVDQAKAALTQAEAQVAGALSDLDRARVAHLQAQGSDLEGAQATLDARKASYEKARSDVQRMKPLADRQEISAQAFDAYKTQADVTENEWKAAQRKLASLQQEADIRRTGVGASEARLAQARAQAAQAKAALEALDLQLSYTRIVAPVEGVVTRKLVETGQVIQPGQGLLTLVPLHQVWVTANFKETQLAKVRPGQEAEIKVDMGGTVLKGKVDSIAGSTGSRMSLLPPENAVGNFVKVVQRIPVKIRIEDSEAAKVSLRPGMNVEATILTN